MAYTVFANLNMCTFRPCRLHAIHPQVTHGAAPSPRETSKRVNLQNHSTPRSTDTVACDPGTVDLVW